MKAEICKVVIEGPHAGVVTFMGAPNHIVNKEVTVWVKSRKEPITMQDFIDGLAQYYKDRAIEMDGFTGCRFNLKIKHTQLENK